MNSPETHLEQAGSTARPCDTCGTLFEPKRAWSRFCDNRCRNAFHASEARLEAIQGAALRMYAALASIARETGTPYGTQAQAAIEGLKPPVEPKALLEKAKA